MKAISSIPIRIFNDDFYNDILNTTYELRCLNSTETKTQKRDFVVMIVCMCIQGRGKCSI